MSRKNGGQKSNDSHAVITQITGDLRVSIFGELLCRRPNRHCSMRVSIRNEDPGGFALIPPILIGWIPRGGSDPEDFFFFFFFSFFFFLFLFLFFGNTTGPARAALQ